MANFDAKDGLWGSIANICATSPSSLLVHVKSGLYAIAFLLHPWYCGIINIDIVYV